MDTRICACIVHTAGEWGVNTIAGYHAVNGEPDISSALIKLRELGHLICLPVIHPETAGEMQFHKWSQETTLRKNRFGINEPAGTATVSCADLDLVLLPLVGFSTDGRRIGMGGGYYDRIFSLPEEGDHTMRCGVAYGLQQARISQPDSWDIPMHAVITERGLFTFKR